MYELKKMERYLRVNLLGPGPSFVKKRIYRVAVSQMLRNTGIEWPTFRRILLPPFSRGVSSKERMVIALFISVGLKTV